MRKHSRVMMVLLLVAAMIMSVLQTPMAVMAEDGEFTMDRGGLTQKDVIVNGENRVVYCMQYDYLWPVTAEGYANPKTVYREATADEMLLTADQLYTVQKVLYAGYPYNAIGAFNTMYGVMGADYAADSASDLTQAIIWALMAGWGVSGNSHYSEGENLGEGDAPGWKEAHDMIMDFVENGEISSAPEGFVPELVGNTSFNKDGENFRSGEVTITNPQGLSMQYELVLPDDVMPVDIDGYPVGFQYDFNTGKSSFSIPGGYPFYLEYYGSNINDVQDMEISIKGTFMTPADVKQYMTDDVGKGDKNDGQGYTDHKFQTMLSIGINSSIYTGTATLTAPTTHVSGIKIWQNDEPANRPNSITISVLKELTGEEKEKEVVATKTVTANDGWEWSFDGLPKYDELGNKVVYLVEEASVHNYSATVNGYNIINTYTPGKTSISVDKEWIDGNNNDGKRPSAVKVYLVVNGEVLNDKYVLLNAANNWQATFDELLEKDSNGNAMSYSVKEEAVEGYTSEVIKDGEGEFSIVNTHVLEKVTVSGSKTWVGDTASARPESITIRLHADGYELDVKEVKADENGNWSWRFEDLPKYENGREIRYTITEDAIKDYDTEINGYNVINTFDPGNTSLEVEKIWYDNEDQDGIRPFSVKIYLLADGKETEQFIELSDVNEWEGVFHHLPQLNPDGTEIVYTVREEEVDGYEPTIEGDMETGYTVINYHEIEKVCILGEKTWVGDTPDARPEYITIRIHANGIEVDSEEVYPDAEGKWVWEFHDMPKFEGKEEIVYTITEDAILNYDVTIKEYNVTNTFDPGNTTLTVEKHWDDDHNNDGIRPEKVTVYLVADGVKTDKSAVMSADNKWEAVFHHLPEYNINGQRIFYTVVEEEVPGYESIVSGDFTKGYLVINSHQIEKISISGSKVWDDASDKDGIRPDTIVVYLMNGETKVDFVKVTAEDEWKWTFENVKKYDGGKEVTYTVMEEAVEGYTAKVTGSMAEGFVITNTHSPKEDENTNAKPNGDSDVNGANNNSSTTTTTPSKDGRPDTGDRSQVGAYLIMMMASMMGVVVSTMLYKKERKLRKNR